MNDFRKMKRADFLMLAAIVCIGAILLLVVALTAHTGETVQIRIVLVALLFGNGMSLAYSAVIGILGGLLCGRLEKYAGQEKTP